ncbi:MAG: VRR-NUC domain-containing protein, partial [Pseudomonadales bacterium]|nr:VRR-NUC domain-containing protein [Pseudomonadales bacterium]
GAFFNPLQRGPADLFQPEFRATRKSEIDDRLKEIAAPDRLRRRVLENLAHKRPIANHFVTWGIMDPALVETTLARVPTSHLVAIFRRLLRDLKHNRSGFPDLIAFPGTGGYLLAEVKGPGDTLQDNQKRWLRFFVEEGIPAEVVNVEWT